MTKKPRITISLNKHQREILGRLAKANHVPVARIVSELVDAATPYLERVVVVVEQAAKVKGKPLSAGLVRSLGRAEGRALQVAEEVLGNLDLFIEERAREAQAPPVADAPRQAPAGLTPVPCNNGGQVVEKGGRTPPKGAPVALAQGIAKAVRRGPVAARKSASKGRRAR